MTYPLATKKLVKHVAFASKRFGSYVIYAYDDHTTRRVESDGSVTTGTWVVNVITWWAT